MDEREELLDEIETIISPQKGVNLRYLIYILLSLSLVCLSIFPKIYIQQQIYFKSRDIAKLHAEYDTLKEENRLIKASVESIKFKNQILDTLF